MNGDDARMPDASEQPTFFEDVAVTQCLADGRRIEATDEKFERDLAIERGVPRAEHVAERPRPMRETRKKVAHLQTLKIIPYY